MTGYIIIFIYVIVTILALIERYCGKYRDVIYITIGIVLILTAGLREVGIDPDSINYENSFINYQSADALDNIEISYIFLSSVVHTFSNDVHFLFLIYALLGVSLKMYAIRKLSHSVFIPLLIYTSYYFTAHECMQIRTGVLSGLYLIMLYLLVEKKRLPALLLLLVGVLFHYSALLLLPFFFLSNKPLTMKKRIVWSSLIPLAYMIALSGFSVLFNMEGIPVVGEKLALYQQANEAGLSVNFINIFGPRELMAGMLFFYLMFFHDTICKYNKSFPLLIKIFAIGFFINIAFSFFPVVSQRTYMLYGTITLILYSNIYYTIRPRWASILVVSFISLIYLNYSLSFIGIDLLWKV